jgi:ubiquinone/menaquinone biosynthesis C-methylase UbiE
MDKLVTTAHERFWHAEAYARDQWVKAQAEKLPRGSFVLDAGAGASKYRPFFAHCQYKTQDFCLYQGPLVKYLQPIDYVCEITAIPLAAGSVDAILCTEVIEHVVDPMAVLAEFHRLLKPGGKLLLTAPLISHLHMEPYHYYGGFTHYWYEFWLPKNGFAIDSITTVGGPGRTCVTFCQAFYARWSEAEKKLPPLSRAVSLFFRAGAKLFVHGILPRVLPKFDHWLGPDLICSTYLVEATRDAKSAGTPKGVSNRE